MPEVGEYSVQPAQTSTSESSPNQSGSIFTGPALKGGAYNGLRMALPLPKSYPPMDAQLIDSWPEGEHWQYEPKWDGFRCLAFRDEKKVDLQSKSGQPLTRYFPEVVTVLEAVKAVKFILDGEIVIPKDDSISFDALLQRIHPAASRIKKLSVETPAILIVFDLLTDHSGSLLAEKPLGKRRKLLEEFSAKFFEDNSRIVLSPATLSKKVARKWFDGVGGALDGIVAKRLDLPYQSANRHGMVKLKQLRSADCVVGGFRYATASREIASLLLGLYDDEGLLHHIGFCSAFSAAERKKLRPMLEPIIKEPGFTGRKPGAPSRWTTERSAEWKPLDDTLVVEVRYDHFTGGRFRHGVKFLRWRPDKAPRQCLISQVEHQSSSPLRFISKRSK